MIVCINNSHHEQIMHSIHSFQVTICPYFSLIASDDILIQQIQIGINNTTNAGALKVL